MLWLLRLCGKEEMMKTFFKRRRRRRRQMMAGTPTKDAGWERCAISKELLFEGFAIFPIQNL